MQGQVARGGVVVHLHSRDKHTAKKGVVASHHSSLSRRAVAYASAAHVTAVGQQSNGWVDGLSSIGEDLWVVSLSRFEGSNRCQLVHLRPDGRRRTEGLLVWKECRHELCRSSTTPAALPLSLHRSAERGSVVGKLNASDELLAVHRILGEGGHTYEEPVPGMSSKGVRPGTLGECCPGLAEHGPLPLCSHPGLQARPDLLVPCLAMYSDNSATRLVSAGRIAGCALFQSKTAKQLQPDQSFRRSNPAHLNSGKRSRAQGSILGSVSPMDR